MAKIKTSELTDAALDWAVNLAHGNDLTAKWRTPEERMTWAQLRVTYNDWSQFGPFIERERIDLNYDSSEKAWTGSWFGADEYTTHFGETPLVAAMRAFCAYKLGNEVDVPDELLQ